ncbi:uncharacterized protein LOC118440734 isoform X1 [Vespa mandarinia]|uniref:uncharacterized protein LOC118440734 isoform X1 n=1 Tax=Vespa mandarinia TaxID=7446 RepID=UPI00160C0968|nr:uncharacterized protein LOC118440734 isoform X1 [Vespa mandarinia]
MSQKLLRLSNWFSFVLRTSKLSHFKRLLATCNIDIFGLFIDFDNYRISSSDVDTSKVSMNVFANFIAIAHVAFSLFTLINSKSQVGPMNRTQKFRKHERSCLIIHYV